MNENNRSNHGKKSNKIERIDKNILKKFKIKCKVGKGAYGVVWKALNRRNKKSVAIKKVYDAFSCTTDAQRTYREVVLLNNLKHNNIIRLLEVMRAQNDKDFYMIFECMETDLHACIKANVLSSIHKRFILYQILVVVDYLHSRNVIHRDLKPSNVFVNSDCHIKLGDFGLARTLTDKTESPILTDYIATRWYRSPEILIGSKKYGKALDMWAVGCILGELIRGKALFPGNSTMDQLRRVISVTGLPEDLDFDDSPYAQQILKKLTQVSRPKSKSFRSFFPQSSSDAIDLMKKLMMFDPRKRITAQESLLHPYVSIFHQKNSVNKNGNTNRSFSSSNSTSTTGGMRNNAVKLGMDDDKRFSINQYRNKLYQISKRYALKYGGGKRISKSRRKKRK